MEEIVILELGLTEIGSPLEERSSETKRQKDKDKEKGRRKCTEELENNQDEIFLTEIYWLPAQEISVQKCFKAYYFNFPLHFVHIYKASMTYLSVFNATRINYVILARKKTLHICPVFLSYISR